MAFDAQHSVNVAECLALADFLEKLPINRFNYNTWGIADCGTTACIAGWQIMRSGRKLNYNVDEMAAADLGLDEQQADTLFNGSTFNLCGIARSAITPIHAARVLRHLAATGEVDWSVALAEPA
jgi:hypothetical protein